MSASNASDGKSRSDVIQIIKTPLAFFTLIVLVIEAALGVIVATSSGLDRTLTIVGMLIVIVALTVVVAIFAWYRPEALFGLRHKEEIDTALLVAPLNEKIKSLTEENERLAAKNAAFSAALTELESIRLQVLGLLAAQSADASGIVRHLGMENDPAARTKVLSVIGKLAEQGSIEADRMRPDGYFRAKRPQ